MNDPSLRRLLDPSLPHHQQLPSDVIVWAERGEVKPGEIKPGEVISRAAHLQTERETRVDKREASQPELERLTK